MDLGILKHGCETIDPFINTEQQIESVFLESNTNSSMEGKM